MMMVMIVVFCVGGVVSVINGDDKVEGYSDD